jgi:DNA-binding NarL/FixJ family response regulator
VHARTHSQHLLGVSGLSSFTIALVEDQTVLRAGLRQIISSQANWQLIWEADSLAQARRELSTRPSPPDLAIVDIGLPDGSGLTLLPELAANTKVLIFSVLGDEENVIRALELGAAGYLLKETRAPEFCAAIESVRRGGAPLTPSVAAHLLKRLSRSTSEATAPAKQSHPALESLTPREGEVLLALARGYSYDEAGVLLGISPHTIGHHVKSIYSKLAVNSKSAAVFEAVQAGWL